MDRRNHRYIAKVGTPPKVRYFYTQEDYVTYMRGGKVRRTNKESMEQARELLRRYPTTKVARGSRNRMRKNHYSTASRRNNTRRREMSRAQSVIYRYGNTKLTRS